MGKAFEKIAGGLDEALAVAKGEAPMAADLKAKAEAAKAATGVEYGRARELMQAACTPDAILSLYRERDEARKSAGEKHDEANRYVNDMLDERKRREAAEAALAVAREALSYLWQPIETAPRDGTRILVWRPREGDEYDAHAAADYWSDKSWYQSRRCQQPTHWMPLPPAPVTKDPTVQEEK